MSYARKKVIALPQATNPLINSVKERTMLKEIHVKKIKYYTKVSNAVRFTELKMT